MNVSPDARTPSATVHDLSGSTPPGAGATMQPFGVATAAAAVAELPDTFTPLGQVAAGVVAGLAARRAAAADPDARVIELAARLKGLVLRHRRVEDRVLTIQERLDAWSFANKPKPVVRSGLPLMTCERYKTETHNVTVLTEPLEVDEQRRADTAADRKALDAFAVRKTRRRARSRAPYLAKLALRMWYRYVNWTSELAGSAPQTMAGLAAKAAIYELIGEHDADTEWGLELAGAVAADAVRLAAKPVSAMTRDTPLRRLRVDHDRAAPLRDAAWDAWNATEARLEDVPLPDALRFRQSTDSGVIGSYQSRHAPFGYTDRTKVEALRKAHYSLPVDITRRDEIATAFDSWIAAKDASRLAAGTDVARDHFFDLSNAASQLRRQIIDQRATTQDDLWHKVAVLLECYDGTRGIEEELGDEEHRGSASADTVALSILLDLGRMLEFRESGQRPPVSNVVPADLPRSSADDAPILAAVAEFCRIDDLQDHLCRTHHADCDDIPGYAATEAAWSAWLDEVADRPALTWAGVVAKAGTMKRHTVHHDQAKSDMIGESLAEDILRLAGRTWDERSNRVPQSPMQAIIERAA